MIVEFSTETLFFCEFLILGQPYENAALQRSAMCAELDHIPLRRINGMNHAACQKRMLLMTFPGAEMAVYTIAINILLHWSKEGFRFVCCVRIVNRFLVLNPRMKIVQTIVKNY